MVVRILYADGSAQSKKAERALESSDLEFQRLDITDSPPSEIEAPHLLTSEGEFDTLRLIEIYAEIYG